MKFFPSLLVAIYSFSLLSSCAPVSYEKRLADKGVAKIKEYCNTSTVKFDTKPPQTGDTKNYRLVLCFNPPNATCKDKFNDVMGNVAATLNKSIGADVEGSSVGKYYIEVVYPNICLVVL